MRESPVPLVLFERAYRIVYIVYSADLRLLGVHLTGDEAHVHSVRVPGSSQKQVFLTDEDPDDVDEYGDPEDNP